MKEKKVILTTMLVVAVLCIIMGGTLAYWTWTTTEAQKTEVTFTVTSDFSCSADGGGDITSDDVSPLHQQVVQIVHMLFKGQ